MQYIAICQKCYPHILISEEVKGILGLIAWCYRCAEYKWCVAYPVKEVCDEEEAKTM